MPPFFFFLAALIAEHNLMFWDIPLDTWGLLSCLCPLSSPYALPAYSLAGPYEKLRKP